jgi:hypothetical protein
VIIFIASNKLKLKNSNKCGTLCMECSDMGECITCKGGVFQYDNLCYTKCPEGTWEDLDWQVCRPCNPDCPVCWGPGSDMCGTVTGVQTRVVLLENEIKKYFTVKPLNSKEVYKWMKTLNIVLQKIQENQKESKLVIKGGNTDTKNNDNNNIKNDISSKSSNYLYEIPHYFENISLDGNSDAYSISPEEIYHSDKVEMDLPMGAFSRKDGVFLPIPSFMNSKMEIVDSHWVYVKGNWDGRNWIKEWFPRLPSFIKINGEKNKIYFENGGYWIYKAGKSKKS